MSADLSALLLRAVLAPSVAMLVVLALRVLVRDTFGARIAYALWLLVPIVTVAAFLPARRFVAALPSVVPDHGVVSAAPVASAQDAAATVAPDVLQALSANLNLTPLVLALWLAGFAVSLALLVRDQWRLLGRLAPRRTEDGMQVAGLGPAVIGVVAPRIVVPADFAERYTEVERKLVLEHERAHIRAGDVQINAIAAFVQCVFWFNPIAYVARAALRVDQELACDERVMHRFGGMRRAYAEAMLKAQLDARALPLGCSWPPVGERPLKQRIAMLARPRIGAPQRAAGAVLCAGISVAAGVGAWLAQPAQPAYAEDGAQHGWRFASGARLVEALMEGDVAEAHRLIRAGADVNHRSLGDGTPLIMAARLEDSAQAAEMAAELLRAGADANRPSSGDGSPLIVAAARGDVTLVRMFVDAGADVNGVVHGDETPLINAARHGRIDAARYLIAHGADVSLAVNAPTIDGNERRSPLSMALRGHHDDMVRLLRDAGARD